MTIILPLSPRYSVDSSCKEPVSYKVDCVSLNLGSTWEIGFIIARVIKKQNSLQILTDISEDVLMTLMKYSQLWSSTFALCSKRCQFVQNGFLVCDLVNIVLLQKYTIEFLWNMSIERILFWCESLPFFKLLLLWITSYFIFIYSHRLLNQQSAIELSSSFEEAL